MLKYSYFVTKINIFLKISLLLGFVIVCDSYFVIKLHYDVRIFGGLMKKILSLLIVFFALNSVVFACDNSQIISNAPISKKDLKRACAIITDLQKQTLVQINKGYGPFLAAIYDDKGNLIAKTSNSVINEKCSNNHAEMNAIKAAEKKLGTYDLSSYNLSLYVTAEPCIMCAGGIMWSGIKNVYYGVSSSDVEKITGFDEGYKPDWINQFKKRGIKVYGNIESELGKQVLAEYVKSGKKVYKPERQQ